jgi:maltooligosyltrehalose trehalohydrolase
MLFQGEEWAASSSFQYFVDFSDNPDLAESVVQGRRKEFAGLHDVTDVPDPQAIETFTRSKLSWNDLDDNIHQEMLAWYRQLIQLRRRLPALVDGRMERISSWFDEEKRTLLVARERVFLAANLGSADCEIELPPAVEIRLELVSSNEICVRGRRIVMPARSVALATTLSCKESVSGNHSERCAFNVNESTSSRELLRVSFPS